MRSFRATVAALGFTLLAPAALAATNNRGLMIVATDNLVLRGAQLQVSAFARIPDDAYAFAAAEFDVESDLPAWTAASAGVISDAGVFGIEASQPNNPNGDPTG